jgi:hypothetical protein
MPLAESIHAHPDAEHETLGAQGLLTRNPSKYLSKPNVPCGTSVADRRTIIKQLEYSGSIEAR